MPLIRQFLLALVVVFAPVTLASAATAGTPVPEVARAEIPPPEIDARSWFLLDHHSGWVLAGGNVDEQAEPASLTKLMTAYVVFHELRKGTFTLESTAHISERAWRTGGSRTFVEVNTEVSIEDLLKGMIVQSGNDASVALAEHVAGTEASFANLMNQYAQQLGMHNTNFVNSMGLPHPDHYSSARDLSLLASAIIREFPEYYEWYSLREFTYNNIRQYSRNTLLGRDPTVDGMKTGYTRAAGYCLIGAAERDGMRLVATVVGARTPGIRAESVQALLRYGFSAYESQSVYQAGVAAADAPVYMGAERSIAIGVDDDVTVTVPRGASGRLRAQMDIEPHYVAPIRAGDNLGVVRLSLGDEILVERPLIALADVPEGGFVDRTLDWVRLWFQ